MKIDDKLWKQAEKITRSITSLYDCCGEVLCKYNVNEQITNEDLNKINFGYMMNIDIKLRPSITFIIYETLRLSKKKND